MKQSNKKKHSVKDDDKRQTIDGGQRDRTETESKNGEWSVDESR